MFTDTHSHIHFQKDFPDTDEIFRRAEESQVDRQIIVGCAVKDSLGALEFVKKYKDHSLWSTLGVHPHDSNQWNDNIRDRYEKLARAEPKIVALGEMGLDYNRNFQPKDVQIRAFTEQLALAKKLGLPAVVHVRDAWEDALDILKESGQEKVVLHCFTSTFENAKKGWERGYYTAFGGALTYPKNDALREVVADAPGELLLLETDCPYMTPQVFRGKRNEPAFVVETARVMAQCRQQDVEFIGRQTTRNAITLFGIS